MNKPDEKTENPLYEYVKKYSELGLTVIPLKAKEKKPDVPWQPYQTRRPSSEELDTWFEGKTVGEVGVGIVCGKLSDGSGRKLAVIDVDNDETFKQWEDLKNTTWVVKTNRGGHIYFLIKGESMHLPSTFVPQSGVEVRLDGHYVAAPPSIHPKGHVYQFLNGLKVGIKEMSDEEFCGFLREKTGWIPQTRMDAYFNPRRTLEPYLGEHPPCIKNLLNVKTVENRNNTALMLAGYFITVRGRNSETTLRELCDWRETLSDKTDFSIEEVMDVVNQATKKPYNFGCRSFAPWCSDKDKCPLNPEATKGEPECKMTGSMKALLRFNVAQDMMDAHRFASFADNFELYVYKDGVYVTQAEHIVESAIRGILGEHCTQYDVKETIAIVKSESRTDTSVFDSDSKRYVCFENGVYDRREHKLIPHSPNVRLFNKLPVCHNPNAKCPTIDRFLSEIVKPEDVITLKEMVAYCLFPDYRIHKYLMLVGEGSNGKSTFLNLVIRLLGTRNCSQISLQQLCEDQFAKAHLFGKLANLFADLPSKALENVGNINILSGDRITTRRMYGKFFDFENNAKMLFSANRVPRIEDDSVADAFFRRWLIIHFPYTFDNESERKADKNLIDKLTIPEELSGFLNEILPIYEDLALRGRFTKDEPTAILREKFISLSDPVQTFVDDCIEETRNLDNWITKAMMYKVFLKFCNDKKLAPLNANAFSRRLKKILNATTEARKMIFGVQTKVWVGARFTSDKEQDYLNEQMRIEMERRQGIDEMRNDSKFSLERYTPIQSDNNEKGSPQSDNSDKKS